MTPLARITDPETSHEAAAVAETHRRFTRLAITEALWALNQATDQEIANHVLYQSPPFRLWTGTFSNVPKPSPSGLRTRRKEMEREGAVRLARGADDSPLRRRNRSGCWAYVFELVPNGDAS